MGETFGDDPFEIQQIVSMVSPASGAASAICLAMSPGFVCARTGRSRSPRPVVRAPIGDGTRPLAEFFAVHVSLP